MLYLQQTFDIHPASPATRDRFVELAEAVLVPEGERLGASLVGAWFDHSQWFSRLTHVLELPGFAAFEAFREKARDDAAWTDAQRQVEELAPERRETLLEPLGPVPVQALHDAIEASREKPEGRHAFAILEVAPAKMQSFRALLGAAAPNLPIVASWRPVAGNPNLVIDLWKGNPAAGSFEPSNEAADAFFRPLREVAPRERIVELRPLPYSPLR